MPRPTEHNYDKLPKWARMDLERLEKTVEHLRDRLNVGPEDSDTFAEPYVTPQPLGKGQRIRFHLSKDGHEYVEAYVFTERSGRRTVSVSANAILQIEPRASNCANLRIAPR